MPFDLNALAVDWGLEQLSVLPSEYVFCIDDRCCLTFPALSGTAVQAGKVSDQGWSTRLERMGKYVRRNQDGKSGKIAQAEKGSHHMCQVLLVRPPLSLQSITAVLQTRIGRICMAL